jgi:predicted PurR-regulated permease PerM
MATVKERPPAPPGSKPAPAETTPHAQALRHAATRAVLLAAVLVVAGILFNELITLVAAFVITVILAILFSSVAAPLERRGVPRPLGALLAVVLVLGLFGGLMALLVPPLVGEVQRFADELPRMADRFSSAVAGITGTEPGRSGPNMERAIADALGDPARFLGPMASLGLSVAGALSAIIVMLITAFYMAARPAPLLDGVVRLFPPQRRDWARHVIERLNGAWSGWLKGVVVDMAVTGLLLYAGLALIGLDFAALFAVLSALLVVIPYFGAIAGGIPPVLLALTDSVELAVLTLAVYLIVQQIEGNVIVPLVMARVVKLHPALIAIGVVVVSQLFGLIGLFVAVPLISATVILAEELWIRPMESRNGARAADGRFTQPT